MPPPQLSCFSLDQKIALNMFLRCSTIVTPIIVGICLAGVWAPMLAQIVSEAGYIFFVCLFLHCFQNNGSQCKHKCWHYENVILFDFIGQSMHWSFSTKKRWLMQGHHTAAVVRGSLEGAWVFLCSEEAGPDKCGHSFPHRSLSLQWMNISSFWLWLIILLLHEKKDSLKIVQLISSYSTGAWVFGLCSIPSFSPLFFHCLS